MTDIAFESEILQKLLRCPSVTPDQAGALDLLEVYLENAGFDCTRLPFGQDGVEVDNLFAIWGAGAKHFGFNGHIDVVPAGDIAAWTHDPFGGVIDDDGNIHGRGAVDMKGGVAAFIAAAIAYAKNADPDSGRISILLTSDEEGEAAFGTARMIDWVREKNLLADVYIVGEPSNVEAVGDTVKYGRRGSLSGEITVHGSQGHSANPHLADNPIPRLLDMLEPMRGMVIDEGNEFFQPTTAVITSIDTGNPARNVIPNKVSARFNIRFTSDHTTRSLREKFEAHFDSVGGRYDIFWMDSNAHPFITKPGYFTDLLIAAINDVTGRTPELATTGGTSDARFIAPHAPVAEFGLVNKTMHKVDEFTTMHDMAELTKTYGAILARFFMDSAK